MPYGTQTNKVGNETYLVIPCWCDDAQNTETQRNGDKTTETRGRTTRLMTTRHKTTDNRDHTEETDQRTPHANDADHKPKHTTHIIHTTTTTTHTPTPHTVSKGERESVNVLPNCSCKNGCLVLLFLITTSLWQEWVICAILRRQSPQVCL